MMIFYTGVQLLLLFAGSAFADMVKNGTLCTVTPSGGKDDSPAIMDAFKQCGQNGQIEITEGDFTIAKVMDVLNLKNCEISIKGKLTWNDDIQYWLKNSISVTYAQRSTAFRLGGSDFSIRGHGKALFFGNGQKWYDQNRSGSNQAGRPISFTLWKATNVFVDGIVSIIQPLFDDNLKLMIIYRPGDSRNSGRVRHMILTTRPDSRVGTHSLRIRKTSR